MIKTAKNKKKLLYQLLPSTEKALKKIPKERDMIMNRRNNLLNSNILSNLFINSAIFFYLGYI